MADYEKLYHKMFNAVTDAQKLIHKADIMLKAVQLECEEMYIEDENKQVTTKPTV